MIHHPGRNGGSEESMAQFKEISEAYSSPIYYGSGALFFVAVSVRDFLELGVDHAIVGRLAFGGFARTLLGGVHGLTQLHRGLDQGVGLGADVFRNRPTASWP